MGAPEGQAFGGPAEMVVIPKGVEHCPVAQEEVHLILIERKATYHTAT